ncbi:hypothetical protein VTP01DRAFT_1480 [Rhizomucor pusillus]|uniref:uncharacterized protein n=1 Tax=Rhizomucor pusillus TaxID=4840 RepID=UPI003743757A
MDQRLREFTEQPASILFLEHIAHQASMVIPCSISSSATSSSSSAQVAAATNQIQIPPLSYFVKYVARRSGATSGTLLGALVLLDRLRTRLAPIARGMPCTCQRIFLATLIVTTKALHDTSPKNKHWARYIQYFTLPEINLMEKQLLALLDFQLLINIDELHRMLARFDNSVMRHISLERNLSFTSPPPPPLIPSTSASSSSLGSSSSSISLVPDSAAAAAAAVAATTATTTDEAIKSYYIDRNTDNPPLYNNNNIDERRRRRTNQRHPP